jgi:hypothetical protein
MVENEVEYFDCRWGDEVGRESDDGAGHIMEREFEIFLTY